MKKDVYIISDSHFLPFSSEDSKRKDLFKEFLDEIASENTILFLVGDIFDFWFEYHSFIPKIYFDIIYKLKQAIASGCEIHIITGNHDYWMGDFFPNKIGITVHNETAQKNINGKNFFITHGDGIFEEDWKYRIVKNILRNKFIIFLFYLIHPDLALHIGNWISNTGSKETMSKEIREEYRSKIINFGRKKFELGFDYIITGHYHLPTLHKENNRAIVNLGDWIEYFTYAHYHSGEIELKEYKNN